MSSQPVVPLTVITDEVFHGYLLQPVYLIVSLITVVTPIGHIGVCEIFESVVVFT